MSNLRDWRASAGNVTLRVVEKGWDATGLLAAHWGKVGGRDELARRTAIQPATLSGYNTGRLPLGLTNARRISDVLEVSLAELGAPEEAADDARSRPVLDRLADLEEEVAALRRERDELLAGILGRMARLEAVASSAEPQRGRRSRGGAS